MVVNLFIFLAGFFILTFFIGKFIEKARIPWIFAALIIGAVLAIKNPFTTITSSSTLNFLSNLGMYFLLFIIGLKIDLRKFKKSEKFIIKSTFFIIFLEAIFTSFIIHYIFHYSWFISILVSLSFATVGEAILIPILDEFNIINSKLGQSIIGIGTLDDIIEILLLVIVSVIAGKKAFTSSDPIITIVCLAAIVILTIGFFKLKKHNKKLSHLPTEILFLLSLFVLFLFIGIGIIGDEAAIGALLAGVSVQAFLPTEKMHKIEKNIKAVCYGFFAPVFFLVIGSSLDINYIVKFPLLILLVVVVSNSAKIIGSYIMGKKELGVKRSILLGIGLSVRFSTSIIIVKILFDSAIIGADLYSVIIASSIVFKFVIPVLFSNLLVKWKIKKKKT